MQPFTYLEDWRSAVIRRPFSCGWPGALLSLTTVGLMAATTTAIFWGASSARGTYVLALPGLLVGMAYFYMAAPMFWRIEKRHADAQRFASENRQEISSGDGQSAGSDEASEGARSSVTGQTRAVNVEEAATAATMPCPEPYLVECQDVADPGGPRLRDFLVQNTSTRGGRSFPRAVSGGILVFLGLAIVTSVLANMVWTKWAGISWLLNSALLLLGIWVVGVGRRVSQMSPTTLILCDERPPIVYLRSFQDDGAFKSHFGIDEKYTRTGVLPLDLLYMLVGRANPSMEVELSRVLSRFGPFIAIGQPGENLAPEGASRMYADQACWQNVVAAAMRDCQLVVWQAGTTPSVYWELKAIVKLCKPQSVVLLVPNPWLMKNEFERFRATANSILLRPIPVTSSDINFVSFDHDWNPRFLAIKYQPLLLQPFLPSNLDIEETLATVVSVSESRTSIRRGLTPPVIATVAFLVLSGLAALTYPFSEASLTEFRARRDDLTALQAGGMSAARQLDATVAVLHANEPHVGWCADNSLRFFDGRPGWVWCRRWRDAFLDAFPGLLTSLYSEDMLVSSDNVQNGLSDLWLLSRNAVVKQHKEAVMKLGRRLESRSMKGKWLGRLSWIGDRPETLTDVMNEVDKARGLEERAKEISGIRWVSQLLFLPQDVRVWEAQELAVLEGRIAMFVEAQMMEYEPPFKDLKIPPLIHRLTVSGRMQNKGGAWRMFSSSCGDEAPEDIDVSKAMRLSFQADDVRKLLERCVETISFGAWKHR